MGDAWGELGCEVIALSGFNRCSWSGPNPSLISARESGTTLLCQPLSAWKRSMALWRLGIPNARRLCHPDNVHESALPEFRGRAPHRSSVALACANCLLARFLDSCWKLNGKLKERTPPAIWLLTGPDSRLPICGLVWADAIPHTRSIALPALNSLTGMDPPNRNVSTARAILDRAGRVNHSRSQR